MPPSLTASSASPGNVLATLLLQPSSSLTATVVAGGAVELRWDASPSAASRTVDYLVLRRPSGASAFGQIARTSALTYTDAPPAGAYDYVVRTVISSFTSADGPIATATTGP